MAFIPQNFVNQGTIPVGASWLNSLDVFANSVFAGAQTVQAALNALYPPNGVTTIALGGTNATTAPTALANLGGTTLSAAVAAFVPLVNNVYNIGSSSFTFANGYFGTQVYVAGVPVVSYPQTPAESLASVTATSMQYPPYTAFRYMTAAQITDVQAGTLQTDTAAALTTLFSIKQASGNVYAQLQPGTYGFSSLTIANNGVYNFQGAILTPTATTSTPFAIQWQAAFSDCYGLNLQGNFNANYGAGFLWNSLGANPSGSNKFYGFTISRTLAGLVFGAVSTPASAVQSENYIIGCHIYECQNPLIVNQPNGELTIIGGEIQCDGAQWPSGFTNASSYVLSIANGALNIMSCELLKAAISTGQGIINTAGSLLISGGSWEIASQNLSLGGGYTSIADINGEYWANGLVSWAVMTASAGSGLIPELHISNFVLNKSSTVYNAAFAFIDFAGFTGWDVSLTDLRLENQLNLIFGNGAVQPNMWTGNTVHFLNVYSPNVGGAAGSPLFNRVYSDVNNLLDITGTDVIGIDINTWYKHDYSGSGTLALNADIPSGSNYVESIQITPASSDASGAYSINFTNLADVQATSIRCIPGDAFKLSGWFRMTTAGTGIVAAAFGSTTGTLETTLDLFDNTNLLTSAWQQCTVLFIVPASCYYLGVGIEGTGGTVCRMVGLKLTKLA